jgi:hypothetical protein
MATKRYSEKTGEVPSRNDDNRLRRTAPKDVSPPSPGQLDKIYNEGRRRFPEMNATKEHQPPQFPEDRHGKSYDNDVPATRWSRGGDLGGSGRPGFDHGKFDIGDKPDRHAAGGGKNTASGSDVTSSRVKPRSLSRNISRAITARFRTVGLPAEATRRSRSSMGIIRDWAAYTDGAQGVPAETGSAMSRRIAEMFRDCMARTGSHRDEALDQLQHEVQLDRRFDPYDPKRLAERVNSVWESGRSFDWEDPSLKRGGQPRPIPLKGSRYS